MEQTPSPARRFSFVKIITTVLFITLPFIGFFLGMEYEKTIQSSHIQVFATQQECEEATGHVCEFPTCGHIPKGKTFEEVCKRNHKQGWIATDQLLISSTLPPVTTEEWKTYKRDIVKFQIMI